MAVWYRRPLFCLCALFMISMSACLFLTTVGRGVVLGVISAVAATLAVLFARRRRWVYTFLCVAAIAVAVLGVTRFCLYFEAPDGKIGQFADAYNTECRVEAVVIERRGGGDNMTTYAVSFETVNGRSVQGTAILTCYYVCDLQVGYAVDMTVAVTDLGTVASDAYDENAMLADGFCVGLVSFEETDYAVTDREVDALSVRLGATRRTLSRALTSLMRRAGASESAQGLPSAMLLGDRSALTDTVRRDFSRSGIAHMLAISGMHMTLLFGILAVLFTLVGIPRRISVFLLAIIAGAYLFFLGFPPSATRAVIMLWAVYLSVALSVGADPLTSLGLAGAGILACSPYAVMDVGFWMSFSATLGLVTVAPLLQRYISKSRSRDARSSARLVRWGRNVLAGLVAGLLTGVVAMTFSMWVTTVAIGEMSLLSPLTTVLLAPALTAVICLTPLCLLLSGMGIGGALALPLARTCDAMSDVASHFSEPSWAVVPLGHAAVMIAVAVLTVLLLLALSIRLPRHRRWIALTMIAVGWMGLFATLGGVALAESDEWKISYVQPTVSSEALVLTEGREATVVDMTNGSKTAFLNIVREAKARGATEIGAWMLTDYTTRTSGSLHGLFGQIKVRSLWLPRPQDGDDYYLMLACMEKAELYGVPVYLYENGAGIPAVSNAVLLTMIDHVSRSARPVRVVEFRTNEQSLLYCSASLAESALWPIAESKIATCDVLIFGNQGPIIKELYGADLPIREDVTVVLADELTAAWLDPSMADRCADLFMGQWRGRLNK